MKIIILTCALAFVACSTTAEKDTAEKKENKAPLAFEYSSSRR